MLLRPASRLRRAALARGLASSSAAAAAGGTPPPALLPVLDLALLAPAPAPAAARAAELARLRAALTSGGGAFSLRTASAVPPALVASAYAALSAFHSLPRDTKMRYHSSRDPRGRGWVPLYEEPVYSTEGEGGGGDADAPVVSHVTAFDLAHDTPAGSPLVGLPGVGPNVWPADESVPGFRDAAAGYYAATTAVARVLFAAAAECLGLQADAFLRLFNPPLARGTMRLLLYPGAASAAVAEARNTGITPHTDFEWCTIMHADAPGLQLLLPSDDPGGTDSISGTASGTAAAWRAAPVPDLGHHLVIADDMLERLTNGAVAAARHRVAHTPHARRALIRFVGLDSGAAVAPLCPHFGAAPRYGPVTQGGWMDAAMREAEGRRDAAARAAAAAAAAAGGGG